MVLKHAGQGMPRVWVPSLDGSGNKFQRVDSDTKPGAEASGKLLREHGPQTMVCQGCIGCRRFYLIRLNWPVNKVNLPNFVNPVTGTADRWDLIDLTDRLTGRERKG